MNPEKTTATIDISNDWQIVTACDISLGRVFAENPMLPKGSYIDIDTQAIQKTLHELDPNSSGTLLVNAVYSETINKSGLLSKIMQSRDTLGHAKGRKRTTEIAIVVAGGLPLQNLEEGIL